MCVSAELPCVAFYFTSELPIKGTASEIVLAGKLPDKCEISISRICTRTHRHHLPPHLPPQSVLGQLSSSLINILLSGGFKELLLFILQPRTNRGENLVNITPVRSPSAPLQGAEVCLVRESRKTSFCPGFAGKEKFHSYARMCQIGILGHSSSLAREKRKFIQGWISYTSKADDTDIIQLLAFLLL